jgi:hypothetical protein
MSPERPDDPEELMRLMDQAVAGDDFEGAARLRDRIAALPGSRLRSQQPGAMGLGTDTPEHRRPEGWVPPKKPDLMVGSTKTGGRRKG